jgi:flagellum-specific peptidoglycan hydrolase FlgJ
MKLIILESQLRSIIEQSVAGAPNYGVTAKPISNIQTQDQASQLSFAQKFSPQNLQQEIVKQGIKYPDIVMAQAKIESGHFSSPIFKENNNLFGMKLPESRKTTAIGKNRGHAKYNTWQDSVKDYKLWQDQLGWSSLPKDVYLQKLSDRYCSPPDCPKGYYSKIVKQTMAKG